MASNLTQMICVEGIVIKASIVRPSSIDAHPTSASATTPSTSTAAASASTSSSSCLTSRLGDVALDVSAAHVGSVHGLDGSLRLVRRGERDEGESFPGIVSIGDSSMLLEGSPQILLGSLLGHVVDEQLGSLHIRPPSSTSCSSTSTTSTSSAPSLSTLLALWSGDVHLNGSAGDISVVH